MNRTPVDSSNLVSVGYEESTSTLEIEFKARTIYQYYGVPASVYAGLMNADSHGQYFDRNIKKAGYKYKQIK